MKAWKNGIVIDEAEDFLPEITQNEPTAEERLEALEAAMLELLEVIAND